MVVVPQRRLVCSHGSLVLPTTVRAMSHIHRTDNTNPASQCQTSQQQTYRRAGEGAFMIVDNWITGPAILRGIDDIHSSGIILEMSECGQRFGRV